MAEWTQCRGCGLKHAVRADVKCPRCGLPGAEAALGSLAGSPVAAAPAVPAGAEALPPPDWSEVVSFRADASAHPPGAYAPNAFLVGRFLSGVFGAWWKNLPALLALVVLLHGPLAIAMYWLYSGIAPGRKPELAQLGVGLVALGLLALVLVPIETAAIARAAVRRSRGEPVELGDALAGGARAYFPVLAVSFLVSLAVFATVCTLFIVPAILLTAWSVAIPALTAERLGPLQALTRSWNLTRGLRWPVFAGFLVVWLAAMAVMCVFQGVAIAVVAGATAAARGPENVGAALGGLQAVSMLMNGLLSTLFGTATGVCYHQLRVARDGPESAALARVFE
jgi:hypothetical protein